MGEMVDLNYGIVSSTAGSNYYVRILSTIDREALKPNTSIALHRHSNSVVDVLPPESDSTVQLMSEKPDVTYKDIGGMDVQKQEVRMVPVSPITLFAAFPNLSFAWLLLRSARRSSSPLFSITSIHRSASTHPVEYYSMDLLERARR